MADWNFFLLSIQSFQITYATQFCEYCEYLCEYCVLNKSTMICDTYSSTTNRAVIRIICDQVQGQQNDCSTTEFCCLANIL